MKKYDIFISYRREGGYQSADSIYQRLTNAGYSAFLDLEQLKAGKFNTKLLEVIDGCQDFILVLPPNALDRCANEDDWVRQEVEHAIKSGKNIVPVMLRGFVWPDVGSLPPSLRELPDYNGISAVDHNVFPENMERLKNHFLVSKRGMTWHSHKPLILSIIAGVVLLVCAAAFIGVRGHKDYEAACREVSMKMMTELVKMHLNVSVAKDVLDVWGQYKMDYSLPNEEMLAREVDFFMDKLMEPAVFSLSEGQKKLLYRHGIPVEDLEAVPLAAEIMYDEVMSFGETVKSAYDTAQIAYSDKMVHLSYDFLLTSLLGDCYAFLYLFSLMPDTVFENVREHFQTLTLLPPIPLDQSPGTYETLQNKAVNELNEINNKLGGEANDAELQLESLKYKLQLIEAEARNFYMEALETCALHPDDDQMTMWNSILMLASLAQSELEREIDEELDPDYIPGEFTEESDRISSKEKYDNVDKWLVQYQRYNPGNEAAVMDYVNSARAYYKAVAERRLDPEIGLLALSVADGLEDSSCKAGDIIIEADGKVVRSFWDFSEISSSGPVIHELKVLRLVDGALKEFSVRYDSDSPSYMTYAHLHQVEAR